MCSAGASTSVIRIKHHFLLNPLPVSDQFETGNFIFHQPCVANQNQLLIQLSTHDNPYGLRLSLGQIIRVKEKIIDEKSA